MKPAYFISPLIYVASSAGKGRGVYAREAVGRNRIIEVSPVIVMSDRERLLLDQTLLHDYIFEWGEGAKQCAMALGYVPLYNHSYKANCEYEMDFEKSLMRIRTVKPIEKGEELFINYNGDWNNGKKLWFDAV